MNADRSPSVGARAAIAEYLPPVKDRRFWITQGLVMAVFATHAVLHAEVTGYPNAFVGVAYAFPVVYASLEFGWRGSVATTLLVVVLTVPYVIIDALNGAQVDMVGHALELAILVIVAPVVGSVVESERSERRAHETAERRYRALFESSGVPTVVLDADGRIQEANPAAAPLLGEPPEGRLLADALGTDLADAILANAAPERLRVGAGLELRPVVSRHVGEDGEKRTQVIFQDVTEEASGQRRARAWALAVLTAQEEERRRISQEIHDEALQLVVELRRRVDRAAKASPNGREDLLGARSLADEALRELRTVAVRLRPPDLDDLGLVASLERLVADASRHDCRTELEVEGDAEPLPPDLALALYRVGQEALTNATHHASASHVSVRLAFGPDHLQLVVQDNGVGFDVARADTADGDTHLGMLGMHERVELVGGTLEVRSSPGAGTTIVATAPR